MAPLYVVFYRSLATTAASPAFLATLLATASRSNLRHGVTGLLLYAEPSVGSGGVFVQWIEGEKRAVQRLVSNLRSDPRHSFFEVIEEGYAQDVVGSPARLFPAWSMHLEALGEVPVTLERFLEYRLRLLERCSRAPEAPVATLVAASGVSREPVPSEA